ncbi:MAG: metallophosphoesterase [Clostridia bacterium]|nr:metallophosphoesterase [Clostridia bacterium]
MKLIHIADLHLDSPMEANLGAEQAKERKNEILSTFGRLVKTADDIGVRAILIAGDLFDSTHITKKTERYVLDLIRSYPNLSFFYLAGNHDLGNALLSTEEKPSNLYTFGKEWTSYELDGVTVTGSESPDLEALSLNPERVNILLLHGQESKSRGAKKEDIIRFPLLKNKHIDYVALGHLHEYRTASIDKRCTACYSGCLEGRGFDECGPKGYVLLEIDGKRLQHTFFPIARRTLHTVLCDISGITSHLELENKLLSSVATLASDDLVKVILRGESDPGLQKDLRHLTQILGERFYFAKLRDESHMQIDPKDYAHDVSLRGEFVRRVLASSLSAEEKERVIACGFAALTGEELGL